uniref:holo-ACP synthase n=1 Tax=Tessaracoccus bendigoensis TaxID=72764 RepID=UPI001587FC8F|nr:4'-phosphopantetheinyl transferase superfamily protein [Tessaracoccus bendigoensis]
MDIVDPVRFQRVVTGHGGAVARRWFDPAELAQAEDRRLCLAECFAVKEAVWKALRLPIAHLPWRDIIVSKNGTAIGIRLGGIVSAEAETHAIGAIHVGTKVCEQLVIATAIAESIQTSVTVPSSAGR